MFSVRNNRQCIPAAGNIEMSISFIDNGISIGRYREIDTNDVDPCPDPVMSGDSVKDGEGLDSHNFFVLFKRIPEDFANQCVQSLRFSMGANC